MKKLVFSAFLSFCLVVVAEGVEKRKKEPKNLSDITGRNWKLTKATMKGKNRTKDMKAKMNGVDLVYTFNADGSGTTTEPNVGTMDWKFEEGLLLLHHVQPIEEGTNTPPAESTAKYTIKKLTKKNLVLEVKPIKMVLYFQAN